MTLCDSVTKKCTKNVVTATFVQGLLTKQFSIVSYSFSQNAQIDQKDKMAWRNFNTVKSECVITFCHYISPHLPLGGFQNFTAAKLWLKCISKFKV